MKTILHIIDSFGRGGAERVVVNNINLFDEYKHVLCLLHEPSDLISEIDPQVHVEYLHFNSKKHIIRSVIRLRKVIRKYKPDFIHAHLLWSSWLARLAKPSNVSLITTIHNYLSIDAFNKNIFSKSIERITASKVNAFITVSRTVKLDYEKHISYKGIIESIYNFNAIKNIGKSKLEYKPGDVLKLICVGNIRAAKNHSFLVEALAILPPQYLAKVQIDIYGSGVIDSKSESIISDLALPIYFKGGDAELRNRYAEYHAFCMPSIIEGMPMALLEAINAELPLLLSSIDVFKELADKKAIFFDITNVNQFNTILQNIIEGDLNIMSYKAKSSSLISVFDNKKEYINSHYNLYKKV